MSEYVLKAMINRLTDNYNKNPDSNLSKLFKAAANGIQEHEETLLMVQEWADIDNAKGAVLDRIGKDFSQPRGQAPDDVYRVMIKSRIKRNLSDGSINTIIDFMAFILNIPYSDVDVSELWEVGKPAVLHINVPGGAINKTGLSLLQFGRLVNLVVALGVRAEVLFEGTFSFSSSYTESEYGNPNGFADDAGTTGGTLGYIYDPKEDIQLPI